ncbi:MAG: iron-siderophore ABC transporter substrate-binding protein [Propionibacteriaceae bacterium]|jgi:iron complex transport system substrate-binding protein|nr:iron-siderophore ABC transporter substrate-binding protein [Propionibacteriaceae bacterium]
MRSRRLSQRIAAFTAAAGLALSGCGTGTTPTPPPATAEAGPTRTVIDAGGNSIQVPTHPERIVTLSEPTLDGVLALGVTPIGTTAGRGQSGVPNYLAGLAVDLPILGGVAQPNFEAIGAAKPDLILVDGTSVNNNPPVIAALGKIAPVVYTGYAGGDWRANFRHTADALNLAEAGEQVITDYDDHVAQARQQLAGYPDSTFSIVRWQGNSASVILKELLPGQALSDLGLRRPAGQDRVGRGHSEPVSLENLKSIDADYLFFGTLGGSSVGNPDAGGGTGIESARQALNEASSVPGFTELDVYKSGHIILVDGSAWTSTGGPLLMNRLIDDVVSALG